MKEQLALRADVMRHNAPAAANSTLIAQKRDTLRYAKGQVTRFRPRVVRFEPGDYVYVVQRNRNSTLQLPTQDPILRVVSVNAQGVCTLRGRCGSEHREHVSQLKPCHLHNVDPIIVDPRISRPTIGHSCEVCGSPDDASKMVLCPSCGTGWHLYCLGPPLPRVPKGKWVCPDCLASGVTVAQVEALPEPVLTEEKPTAPRFPSAAQCERHARYAALDGRQTRRLLPDGAPLNGTVKYLGWQSGRESFEVVWDYGSSEVMGVRQLNQVLVGDGGQAKGQKKSVRVVVVKELSAEWDLGSKWAVASAWSEMVPGTTMPHTAASALVPLCQRLESQQGRDVVTPSLSLPRACIG